MNLFIIFLVLFSHWIADFILQKNTKKTIRDKKFITKLKKLIKQTLPHSLMYSIITSLFIFISQIFNILNERNYLILVLFFLLNFLTHFITDTIVTLVNETYLKKNKRHAFVVSVGFDQLIHYMTLFVLIDLIIL